MNDDMFLEAEIVNDLIDESYQKSEAERIQAAIKIECDRQHVGEDRREMLYEQYKICRGAAAKQIKLETSDIQLLAGLIEPSNGGKFRITPVSFNGIVGGVPPHNIERAMEVWIDWFCAIMNSEFEVREVFADQVIQEFLDIHPFSDGNGRTAWLLRVWMLNQWDNPQPLPNYYKES